LAAAESLQLQLSLCLLLTRPPLSICVCLCRSCSFSSSPRHVVFECAGIPRLDIILLHLPRLVSADEVQENRRRPRPILRRSLDTKGLHQSSAIIPAGQVLGHGGGQDLDPAKLRNLHNGAMLLDSVLHRASRSLSLSHTHTHSLTHTHTHRSIQRRLRSERNPRPDRCVCLRVCVCVCVCVFAYLCVCVYVIL
jgi:hypothetical protein